jgi:D-3-phosphoglycerate dehydrogenase
MAFKVLIADKSDKICETILKERGLEPVVKTGMTPEELKACIGEYDAIVVRSATTLTADILKEAKNMKVAVRAGAGYDNIDVAAAKENKIVVMNTPTGNSQSAAEHAFALMMALARQIPQANTSTHAGKWEKSKFKGVEICGKTVGIVGCGNIGKIFADMAHGHHMTVLGFDPFLSDEVAAKLGIKKVTMDELYAKSDFVTYHTILTPETKGMVNKEAIARMKKGIRLINCSRGAIMNEQDILEGIASGQIAGLACDVYANEPAKEHPFFGNENIICTPHIAASTKDAQIRVAQQAAEQIADFLIDGNKRNAVKGSY